MIPCVRPDEPDARRGRRETIVRHREDDAKLAYRINASPELGSVIRREVEAAKKEEGPGR